MSTFSALLKITSKKRFGDKVNDLEYLERQKRAQALDDFIGSSNAIGKKEAALLEVPAPGLDGRAVFIDKICNDITRLRDGKIARQTRWKIPTEFNGNKTFIIQQCYKRCKGVKFTLEIVGELSYVLAVM